MFTASHNPAQYNGIKMCRAGARPDRPGHRAGRDPRRWSPRAAIVTGARAGHASREHDVLDGYAAHLLGLAPVAGPPAQGRRRRRQRHGRPHRAGGLRAARRAQVELIPMYFELDGTFPNHEANPIDPANLVDLQARVLVEGADIGLAFDGDADRCFLVDERGEAVSPSTLTALIAARELAKRARLDGDPQPDHLAAPCPRSSPSCGGTPVRTRVGHSFIKADDGRDRRDLRRRAQRPLLLPRLLARRLRHARRAARARRAGRDRPARCRSCSPSTSATSPQRRDQLRRSPTSRPSSPSSRRRTPDATASTVDHLDGLTVDAADWWFNVRAVQHRTPAPAQRRGQRPPDHDHDPRRGARPDPEGRHEPRPRQLLDDHRLPRLPRPRSTVDGASELVCSGCGLAYPVRDDIPVLLVDEARKP